MYQARLAVHKGLIDLDHRVLPSRGQHCVWLLRDWVTGNYREVRVYVPESFARLEMRG